MYYIQYEKPATKHKYTPDFVLPNGIIIEAKGIFEREDRQKHLLIKMHTLCLPESEVEVI